MTPAFYAVAGAAVILRASFVRRTRKYDEILLAVAIGACCLLILPLCSVVTAVRATTVDQSLRGIDALLGMDGSWIRAFCLAHPLFWIVCLQVYNGIVFMFAAHWAIERSATFLRAVAIGSVLAVPFYLLVPACGPRYLAAGQLGPFQPRNCFPSMHLTCCLLMILNAKKPAWRAFLCLYAAVMIFATIGSGEHYAIDLIAAVPFTFAVQRIAEWRPGTRRARRIVGASQKCRRLQTA